MAPKPGEAPAAGAAPIHRGEQGSLFHSLRNVGLRAFSTSPSAQPPRDAPTSRGHADAAVPGSGFGDQERLPYGKMQFHSGSAQSPMISLIAAPWVIFIASCMAYTLFWYVTPLPLALTTIALLVGLPASLPPRHRRDGATPGAKLLPAGMCLLAAVFGVLLGVYTYEYYVAPFYAIGFGRHYDNVLASTPGAAYMDAGRLRFADTSSVQSDMALGYRVGPTYCVAPIMDSGQQQVRKVTFWAIGMDCCGSRGSFSCGSDAGSARGGVRAVPDGIFAHSRSEYVQALQQAASISNLVVDANPILVHWVSDPAAEQRAKLLGASLQFGLGMMLMVFVSLGAFTIDSVWGFSRGTPQLEGGQLPA